MYRIFDHFDHNFYMFISAIAKISPIFILYRCICNFKWISAVLYSYVHCTVMFKFFFKKDSEDTIQLLWLSAVSEQSQLWLRVRQDSGQLCKLSAVPLSVHLDSELARTALSYEGSVLSHAQRSALTQSSSGQRSALAQRCPTQLDFYHCIKRMLNQCINKMSPLPSFYPVLSAVQNKIQLDSTKNWVRDNFKLLINFAKFAKSFGNLNYDLEFKI